MNTAPSATATQPKVNDHARVIAIATAPMPYTIIATWRRLRRETTGHAAEATTEVAVVNRIQAEMTMPVDSQPLCTPPFIRLSMATAISGMAAVTASATAATATTMATRAVVAGFTSTRPTRAPAATQTSRAVNQSVIRAPHRIEGPRRLRLGC